MAFLSSLDIPGSGLTAQKRRMDVIAENITNRDTTRTEDGGPYRRKLTVFSEIAGTDTRLAQTSRTVRDSRFPDVPFRDISDRTRRDSYVGVQRTESFARELSKARLAQSGKDNAGVMVSEVFEDENTPLVPVYDPNHPDANEEGYVMMPNVNTTIEMVDAMAATRSYSANLAAFEAVKAMATQALQMGR